MKRMQDLGHRRFVARLFLAAALCLPVPSAVALGLPLQISQYAHTSWTAREGADLLAQKLGLTKLGQVLK